MAETLEYEYGLTSDAVRGIAGGLCDHKPEIYGVLYVPYLCSCRYSAATTKHPLCDLLLTFIVKRGLSYLEMTLLENRV
jgi:hypothetical protein